MDVKQKLKIARVILIQNQPFYASLVMRMKIIPDAATTTAKTDGVKICYSPEFFHELSTDEVAGVLAHEVMHIANLHHTRMGNRELDRWNRACDYAINPILIAGGLRLPESCLLNPDFERMSAEQIYELLPATPPGQAPELGIGGVVKPPPDQDLKRMEALVRHAVTQAILDATMKKKLPVHLQRLVQEILSPRIDWQHALASYLTEICRGDYSWTRPSPRYLYRRLYLPLLESRTLGKLILIVDTSISIDDAMINQFAGEVQDITRIYSTPLQVIYVDDVFQSIQDIDPDDEVELKPQGGGCTDFCPGFDYIAEHDLEPKAVIYLTDGVCHSFPEPPDYPVLWAQFGSYPFDPPFGETIQVA